ncbi:MAG: DUF2974 domain-containing protein [Lachnospiraceae bacterium]|nr:DUF2974 domain-containing protein [Lachnospiraceae bacterium]
MGTVLDYLREYGDYTLEEKPFNEVDSLILSQFSYLKFDEMMLSADRQVEAKGKAEEREKAAGPEAATDRVEKKAGMAERAAVSLEEIFRHENYDSLYGDERYRRDNTALFLGMYGSRRFHDTWIENYVNRIDLDTEMQFSAVTIHLPDGMVYVAFRGTDESIVGWKEDLNLAFSEPVPGQRMSVEYLNDTTETFTGDFCVGGHSKGGNLAVYASMNCRENVRSRITAIYDHDGPGFRPEVKAQGAYEEIAGRIRKTVPRSSLVGMLLYSEGRYEVVESRTIGLAQHNPYSWLVREDAFVVVNDIYTGRKFMDEALNQWILSLSQEEMHTFVDTFYQVILASETDNLIDFTANWMQSLHRIRMALKELEPETEKAVWQTLRALLDIISSNMKERFRNRNEADREKLEEGIRQLELDFRKQS